MIETRYGFIKLYRGLADWRWYKNPNTLRLYIHCLMKAYFQETERLDMKIPAGSFETSYGKLARELDLTKKQIRTALENLKRTGEVAYRATRQCSIITVIGYEQYGMCVTEQGTFGAPKGIYQGTKRATNKEYKKGRKEELSWKI